MSTWEITHRINGGPTSSTGPFYNVHHVHTPDDSSTTVTAIVAKFDTFWNAIKAIYGTGQNINSCLKIVRVDVDPPVYIAGTGSLVGGSATNTFAPAQCCMVVSWRTAVATRHGRGRTYLGPLSAAALAGNGDWSATLANTVQTASNALIANIKTVDPVASLVVWRRPVKAKPGVPAVAGAETPITSATVSSAPFTQRRRML